MTPKKLWQSMRKVLHRTSETVLPAHSSEKSLADTFASFFTNKISKIRDTFPTSGSFNNAPESVPPAFNTFKPVTEDNVSKCIKESPTKSSPLDPIPTFLLKDCLDILLPSITKLVSYSLTDGSFPSAFKKAVATPLITKASLPRNNLKNYHLVSGLCFLSKLGERVVAKQLMSHINNNKLDNPHQSAYKPGHSTKTALLSEYVKRTCKACFLQMRDLCRIRQYLTPEVAVLAANALVISRLDYCYSLFRGLSCFNQQNIARYSAYSHSDCYKS